MSLKYCVEPISSLRSILVPRSNIQKERALSVVLSRAYSKVVLRGIRIAESRVRLPVGPHRLSYKNYTRGQSDHIRAWAPASSFRRKSKQASFFSSSRKLRPYSRACHPRSALVVQRIGCFPPKEAMQVQFLPRAPFGIITIARKRKTNKLVLRSSLGPISRVLDIRPSLGSEKRTSSFFVPHSGL